MRALLGWIIYIGPCGEQTYVSQSHQRHSKAVLARAHTYTEVNSKCTLGHAMYQVQALTSWRTKLTFSQFNCQTCRGKAGNMWLNIGERSSASKLHSSCCLFSQRQLTSAAWIGGFRAVVHVGHVLFCLLCWLAVAADIPWGCRNVVQSRLSLEITLSFTPT